MVMGMDVGQLLLWGVMGLVGLVILIAMGSWLRHNKEKTIVSTNGDMTVTDATLDDIATGTDATTAHVSLSASGADVSAAKGDYILTNPVAKSSSWGFWPWALISALVLGGLGWLVWNSSLDLAAGSFKWILWSLLAMAGLLTFLGFAQMSRHHPMVDEKRGSPRGLGFLTLISGLVLGLASWFVWQPQIAGFSGLQEQISGFEGVESKLRADNKGLSSKLISRNTVIKRLTADVEKSALSYADLEKSAETDRTSKNGEITRLNDVIAQLTTGRTSMSAENARLKGLVGTSSNDGDEVSRLQGVIRGLTKDKDNISTENSRMQGLLGTYKNDSEVQNAKISGLEADLAALRNKPAVTRSVTTSAPRETPLEQIHNYSKDDTLLGLTSDNYNVVKAAEQKMVQGRNGHFYYINLINPANGRAYKFASASYSSVKNQAQFKSSLDKAIADIKGAFDDKRGYQLYVRGKASAGRYSGKMAPGFEYTDMKVLERGEGKTYGTGLVDRHYEKTISNDDLPNMRGAYLQEYIGKNYDVAKPIILDGRVSKSKDVKKQALSVILFVED